MTKKTVTLFAAAAMIMAVSCKKDEKHTVLRNGQEVLVDGPATAAVTNETPVRTPPADGKYPLMTFTETDHDFGAINQGDKVSYSFAFKNTGEADLIIADAKGSCGCTVPEYPKDPVKPGESGEIKVSFNSAGKVGMQLKTVTLTTNTAVGKEIISIKASINPTGDMNMQPVATPTK